MSIVRDTKEKELVENLKKSRESLVGELYPILEAADGEVVDGFHRVEAGWESRRRLENISTRLQKMASRWLAHQRRTMTFAERRAIVDGVAEELIRTGEARPEFYPNIPEDLRDRPKVIPKVAEILCVSEHTVALFISDKYKRGTTWKKEAERKTKGKRSLFETRGDVLEILDQEKEGIRPTPLMYKTNLSWRPLTKSLSFLYRKGLVDILGGESPRYVLTELGRKVAKQFRELKGYLL